MGEPFDDIDNYLNGQCHCGGRCEAAGIHGIFAVVICTTCKQVRSYDLRGPGPRLISRGGDQ